MARKKIGSDQKCDGSAAAAAAAASSTCSGGGGETRAERKAKQYQQQAAASGSSPAEQRRAASASPPVAAADAYLQPGDAHFVGFRKQLAAMGLMLRDIKGDGNCLFRALADQMEGYTSNHMHLRMDTVRHMIQHRADFEPFVDVPFERHMDLLSRHGTYAGQDALVAFARLHKLRIVIHQLNSPVWTIDGSETAGDCAELHLSYHNCEHYSSVRRVGDTAAQPANVCLSPPDSASSAYAVGQAPHAPPGFSASTQAHSFHANGLRLPTGAEVMARAAATAFGDSATEDDGLDSGAECLRRVDPAAAAPLPSDDARLLQHIIDATGQTDAAFVQETLLSQHLDVEATIDYLINLSLILNRSPDDPPPAAESRASQPPPRAVVGRTPAAPQNLQTKKHLSNRDRKDLQRREKLGRQAERRADERAFHAGQSDGDDEQQRFVVSQLGRLNL